MVVKVYVAGKVSKNSVFGTHYWRDEFCDELARLSGLQLVNLDPTKSVVDQANPEEVFGNDCYLISKSDVVIAYLTDDVSVGGSQEILIAKYFKKPVIGLAPYGGKFNGRRKEFVDQIIDNYKDPFVFSTCDIVCGDSNEIAEMLTKITDIHPKTIDLIAEAVETFRSRSSEK